MSPVLAFGDDHSPEADLCWDWIASHVWGGWSLDVVTADPPADMHPVAEEKTHLHNWTPPEPRSAEGLGFESMAHLRAEVDPRVALISRPWDLVAVGPRGSGLLKRLHLGSTADWLLREPTSPLVVTSQPGPVRSIVFAADGSPHAERALRCLLSLPWITGTRVNVLSVSDGHVDAEQAGGQAAKALADAGVDTDLVTRSGKPASVIVEECERLSPELVAMGARGVGGLQRLMLGSTTAAVTGAVEHTILVAHAEGFDGR
jgi:nucleotide-binding universal stress UspA family protein